MKSLIVASIFILIAIGDAVGQYPSSTTPIYQVNSTTNLSKTDSVVYNETPVDNIWDHLTIISDSRIDSLLQIYKEENKRNGIKGYRVQIFQGTKDQALKMEAKFLSKYPAYKTHLPFQTPDFKVMVGDFRTRSEALKLRSLIKNDFIYSFVVFEEIDFPELVKK